MDSEDNQSAPLLTINDVMARLNVGERFVRRLIAERRIGYLKVGAKVRFTREDVDEFVSGSRACLVTTRRWDEPREPFAPAEFLES